MAAARYIKTAIKASMKGATTSAAWHGNRLRHTGDIYRDACGAA